MTLTKKLRTLSRATASDDAEATPTGIRLKRPAGSASRLVGYAAALRRLESGEFDHDLAAGKVIAAALLDGIESGWFRAPDADIRAVWRWVVVAVFIDEQTEQCGTVSVIDEEGQPFLASIYETENSDIALIPAIVRMMLEDHIEQASQRFIPPDQQAATALQMYQQMLTTRDSPPGVCLSAWGRYAFRLLHEWLEEALKSADGPVLH